MKIDKKINKLIDDFHASAKPARSLFFWRQPVRLKGIVSTPTQSVYILKTNSDASSYYALSWVNTGRNGEGISYEANFDVGSHDIHVYRIISYSDMSKTKNVDVNELSEINDSQEYMQSELIKLLGL